MNIQEHIKDQFRQRFGGEAPLYAAPGRVNLIGEHTDYNLGFVLPGAIDKAIYAALRLHDGPVSRVYSVDYDQAIDLDFGGPLPEPLWARYIYGVVREMREQGAAVGNFDCVFGGDVPLGAGLSSSAALESVFGYALNDLHGTGLTREQLARIGQMTEHHYVGVKCGIMDQFASLLGQKGHALLLDCRTLEYKRYPFAPESCRLALIDSMVKHSLASTEYNVRREQCEAGVAVIARREADVASLRDVTPEMLKRYRDEMDPVVYRRCAYVVEENRRVLDSVGYLVQGDYESFGRKMYASHDRLSREYEVSCPEIDFIVEGARGCDGVLGARMMGGGFGGCVIHLVRNEAHDGYLRDAVSRFEKKFDVTPRVIDVVIGDGARKIG